MAVDNGYANSNINLCYYYDNKNDINNMTKYFISSIKSDIIPKINMDKIFTIINNHCEIYSYF
jgi:hypothetical protein